MEKQIVYKTKKEFKAYFYPDCPVEQGVIKIGTTLSFMEEEFSSVMFNVLDGEFKDHYFSIPKKQHNDCSYSDEPVWELIQRF